MDQLAPAIAVPTMLAVAAWVIRIIVSANKEEKITRMQAELHGRVLDRCGSPEELARYFESDLGESLKLSRRTEHALMLDKILSSLRTAVVLMAFSVAFLMLRNQVHQEGAKEGFVIFGGLGLALSVGFLLASALSYYLSKSWGLLHSKGNDSGDGLPERQSST